MPSVLRLIALAAAALAALPGSRAAASPTLEAVAVPPAAGVVVAHDLRYGPWPAQRLDLYRPAGAAGAAGARRPLVLWVHGGGFRAGSKDGPKAVSMARAFARRGYVAAAIDYRLLAAGTCAGAPLSSPRCTAAARAAAADARLALRWLRADAPGLGIASRRVAIGGSSAGAIASLLVATRPQPGARVQAVVSVAGGLSQPTGLTPGDPPAILFNGSDDRAVPFSWSRRTASALDACGVPVRRRVFAGAGHDLWAHRGEIARDAAAFLGEHLAPPRRGVVPGR